MSFSNLQFPNSVQQCGEATFSWDGGRPDQYPARLELYMQDGTGPWQTLGTTVDVNSSPYTFTINVPAGMTVWPTITGHDGSYNQIRVGSTVLASGNDACLPTTGTQTLTVTDVSTALQTLTETVVTTGLSTVTVSGDVQTVSAPRTETVLSTVTRTRTMDAAEDDAEFTADSSWAIENSDSLGAAPTGGMQPEVGASFNDLQASASSYRTATYALGALFAAACLGILFLLFVLRRTRRRRQQPLRPRIARFTDDGSFMSERSTAPSYGAEASSNPFNRAVPAAVTPSTTHSPTLRNSLGFADRRNSNTGPQPPVSSLFLQVPNNRGGDNNSINEDETELSRMGTINSVDERQTTGLQNLYVRNHSQFTLNSANSENDHNQY